MKEKIKGKLFFFTREVSSLLFLLELAHCLTRNLTVHSSTNTAFGNIVTFSTLSPLHQFPFAQKTGSPL